MQQCGEVFGFEPLQLSFDSVEVLERRRRTGHVQVLGKGVGDEAQGLDGVVLLAKVLGNLSRFLNGVGENGAPRGVVRGQDDKGGDGTDGEVLLLWRRRRGQQGSHGCVDGQSH